MLKNYFKIAWRNLWKNKVFSFINLFGLAVGLACCMLIAVFIYEETSYDKYAAQAVSIYRVGLGTGDASSYPLVDVAVGPGIKNAFPEVQAFTRIMKKGDVYVDYQEKQFSEPNIAYADADFLAVFSIPFIDGDAKTALAQPNSIVISKAFATKYFGNEEPVGKILNIGKKEIYKVTGVIDKVPDRSHFHFDAFISMSSLPHIAQTWSNVGYYTYLVLNKDADAKKLEAKFSQLVEKYVVPEIQRDMGVSLTKARETGFRFFLQRLSSIHLQSDTKYEIETNGDINYVYIFGALAIFVLLLACVNFTNLSTASSSKRAREVGIRKVVGAVKNQLIYQFLSESILLTFGAMFVAYLIVFTLLPYFNAVAGKHILFSFFLHYRVVAIMLLLCLFVGGLAGIYPAFFISSFKTISVLKGSASISNNRKSLLRSGLVVFQFFISTSLIIATIVVYRQLHFMQDKKLGYDKEQVLYLPGAYLLGARQVAFKQQLLRDNQVLNVSISRHAPGNGNMNGTEIYAKNDGSNAGSRETHTNIYNVDYDFVPTLGIRMVQGRNFSIDFPTDSAAVIINESAVKELGWENTNVVGKIIVRSGQREFKVIGVVADFHYASVKQRIAPLMLLPGSNYGGMLIKVKTRDIKTFLTGLKNQWDAFEPAGPFSWYFLNEKFASLYASEQKTGQIFTSFAIVAIVIASLGLFGLATFITQQRTKEIGVRKVLGASERQVLVLVSKEFLLLVVIAFVIAMPVTWWAMYNWLQDFAYRINISWWIFIAAGVLAITIALFTISYQAIKAAIANPVNSLRTE